MGRNVCPGREPDCPKPAGTGVGISARMYNDSNSLGDTAKEGRGSERRHAGTGEGISAHIHVANLHGDKAEEGRRSDRRHSANSLWERDDFLLVGGGQHRRCRRRSSCMLEWVCVSRRRGGELSRRLYGMSRIPLNTVWLQTHKEGNNYIDVETKIYLTAAFQTTSHIFGRPFNAESVTPLIMERPIALSYEMNAKEKNRAFIHAGSAVHSGWKRYGSLCLTP